MSAGPRRNGFRRIAVSSGVAALVALGLAASADSAATLHYKGRTAQQRSISFRLASGSVSGLKFTIVDTCPHRKILYVHDSDFPSMAISQNRFGGTFTAKPPATATVVVSARVSRKTVSGTLSDRSKNNKTHKFCSGKTTFRLRPS